MALEYRVPRNDLLTWLARWRADWDSLVGGEDSCRECGSGPRCDGCAYDHEREHTAEREALPPCVQAMKCYCAGHAAGNDATEPCDTDESKYLSEWRRYPLRETAVRVHSDARRRHESDEDGAR